jgi:hypothetical protein
VLATDGETEARIRAVLDSLVRERRELRRSGVERAALEANRLAIVYWQQALSSRLSLRAQERASG